MKYKKITSVDGAVALKGTGKKKKKKNSMHMESTWCEREEYNP